MNSSTQWDLSTTSLENSHKPTGSHVLHINIIGWVTPRERMSALLLVQMMPEILATDA